MPIVNILADQEYVRKTAKELYEFKDIGEFPDDDPYEIMDGLVDEGKYRFRNYEFVYSVIVERPEETTVSQQYWSTEEGVQYTYYRTGRFDEADECFYFGDWSCPITSDQANSIYSTKSHTHYTQTSTNNFSTWINTYRAGETYVYDSSVQKYYLVKQFGYGVALNNYIRRYQEYFEITEPEKIYTRTGRAMVGNSSVITWSDWKMVGEDGYIDLGIDSDPLAVMDELQAEGKYRVSDGEYVYNVTVETPDDSTVGQSYWSTEEGIQYPYVRNGIKNASGGVDFEDWYDFLLRESANAIYAYKNHSHNISDFATSVEDAADTRESLSTIGFVTGQYNTVEEFWEAITVAGNYSKVLQTAFRFKDLGGWAPFETVNYWYQGFATWQNNPNSTTYSTDGVILLWRGVHSVMYRGTVQGNYNTGLTIKWRKVYDEDSIIDIAHGGTGAKYTSTARANLELNPVSVWSGNQSSGSLSFEYGYQYYLIRAYSSTGFNYTTMTVIGREISSGASNWVMKLDGENYLKFKMNRVEEAAEDGTVTRTVNLEFLSGNAGTIMVIWGFN